MLALGSVPGTCHTHTREGGTSDRGSDGGSGHPAHCPGPQGSKRLPTQAAPEATVTHAFLLPAWQPRLARVSALGMRPTHGLVARSSVPSSLWSCRVERAAGLTLEAILVPPTDGWPAWLAHTFHSGQQGLLLTGACCGPGVQLRRGRPHVLLRPESPSRASSPSPSPRRRPGPGGAAGLLGSAGPPRPGGSRAHGASRP